MTNSNGNRPCIELYQAPELKRIIKRKVVRNKPKLTADDIMKITLMICTTIIISTLIVCAYLSGMMIGILLLIVFFGFLVLMFKSL